jgi:hypothetical protein
MATATAMQVRNSWRHTPDGWELWRGTFAARELIGTVYRNRGGWSWKHRGGRNAGLAGEKPTTPVKAKVALLAFVRSELRAQRPV